jgi:hypothetical protein
MEKAHLMLVEDLTREATFATRQKYQEGSACGKPQQASKNEPKLSVPQERTRDQLRQAVKMEAVEG